MTIAVQVALALLFAMLFARIALRLFPHGNKLLEATRHLVLASTDWAVIPVRDLFPPAKAGRGTYDVAPLIVLFVVQAALIGSLLI